MPYYRKLTPQEQADVNKSMRKCWVVAFGVIGIAVMAMICVISKI